MTANPSQNAMKHGLTSRLQLPADENQNYEEIHQQLLSTFKPITDDELMLVGDMAFSRTLSDRAYRLINESMDEETRLAPEILDRQEQANFDKLLAGYHKDPIDHQPAMFRSVRGITHIIGQWEDALAMMTKPHPAITLTRIFGLVASLGSNYLPSEITARARPLVTLFIQSYRHQGDKSKPSCKVDDRSEFEMEYIATADEVTEPLPHANFNPWAELVKHIKAEIEQLRAHRNKLMTDWNLHVENQVRLSMGLGLGSPERTTNVRLMQRYALSNANRFDRLTGKLRTLIDKRIRASELEKKKLEAEAARLSAEKARNTHEQSGKSPQQQPVTIDRKLMRATLMNPEKVGRTRFEWLFDVIDRDGKVEYLHQIRFGNAVINRSNIGTLKGLPAEQHTLMVQVLAEATMDRDLFQRDITTDYTKPLNPVDESHINVFIGESCVDVNICLRAMEYTRMFFSKLGRMLRTSEILKCIAVAKIAISHEAKLQPKPALPAESHPAPGVMPGLITV